jgi:hypothetical protein
MVFITTTGRIYQYEIGDELKFWCDGRYWTAAIRTGARHELGVEVLDEEFDYGHDLRGKLNSNSKGWYIYPSTKLIVENPRPVTELPAETCSHCGEVFAPNYTFKRGSKRYCMKCRDELYPTCSICRRRHVAAHTSEVELSGGRKIKVCDGCRPTLVTCAHCGELQTPRFTTRIYTGEIICDNCRLGEFVHCSSCGDWYPVSEVNTVRWQYGSTEVCNNCMTRLPTCDHCGERYLQYHGAQVRLSDNRTITVCPTCRRTRFRPCAYCNNTIEGNGHVLFGLAYCDDCFQIGKYGLLGCSSGDQTTWRPPSGVATYSYKPTPIMYPKLDTEKPIYYGIELEVDSNGTVKNDHHLNAGIVNKMLGYSYVKRDGSLNNGMEIVTHPAHLEYHTVERRDQWVRVMDYLRRCGYTGHNNGRCGLHIHVSSAPLEILGKDVVEKVIFIFSKHWNKLVRFSRRDTRTDAQMRWAKRVDSGVADFQSDEDAIATLKMTKERLPGDRYRAINLNNRNTIEFRLFRSTLKPETFFATLQLVDVIIRAAIKYPFKEIRAMSWDDLVASNHEELNAYLASRDLVCGERNWIPEDDDEFETLRYDVVVEEAVQDYSLLAA